MAVMHAYSVVIPAHNAAPFIEDTLDSVLAQSVRPAEVIVIDDGSIDDTGLLATRRGCTVIRFDSSRGPSAGRNAGLDAARNELVAFIDADDLWREDHAALSLRHFSRDRIVLSCAGFETFGAESSIHLPPFPDASTFDARDELWTRNPVLQSSVFLRKDAAIAVGGYDETLRVSEDFDLWFRLSESGQFAVTSDATVKRRVHPGQISARQTFLRSSWDIRLRHVIRRCTNQGDSVERLLPFLRVGMDADIAMVEWMAEARVVEELRECARDLDKALGVSEFFARAGGGASGTAIVMQMRMFARRLRRWIRGR